MKPSTKIAIGGVFAALAAALTALATEFGLPAGEAAETPPADPTPETTKPAKPKKTEKPAAAAEPTPEPAAAEEPAGEPNGKTYEDMKALIKPFVEAGQGADVKKIIAKYATTLKEMDPKHFAAFEKDIATLEY